MVKGLDILVRLTISFFISIVIITFIYNSYFETFDTYFNSFILIFSLSSVVLFYFKKSCNEDNFIKVLIRYILSVFIVAFAVYTVLFVIDDIDYWIKKEPIYTFYKIILFSIIYAVPVAIIDLLILTRTLYKIRFYFPNKKSSCSYERKIDTNNSTTNKISVVAYELNAGNYPLSNPREICQYFVDLFFEGKKLNYGVILGDKNENLSYDDALTIYKQNVLLGNIKNCQYPFRMENCLWNDLRFYVMFFEY